jgi:hypothetical protein
MSSWRTYFQESRNSKIQEQLAEAWFIRDFILAATSRGLTPLVARSDMDLFGFDLILGLKEQEKLLRVQMKAFNGKARLWDVHRTLLQQQGQVVIARLDLDGEIPKIRYLAVTQEGRAHAIDQPPKVEHPGKCMLKLADVDEVTDLMDLFSMG